MTENNFWGYHLSLDCAACDIALITMKSHVENFSRTLVERIDMKAYGEPWVVHFAEHDIDKAGFTLIQLIETSNIAAHFVDKNGDAYIDVFSCKPFDNNVVIDVVHEFFHPKNIKSRFFTRKAEHI